MAAKGYSYTVEAWRGRLNRDDAVDWGCGLVLHSGGLSRDEEDLIREIVSTAAGYLGQGEEDAAFAAATQLVLHEWGIAEEGK